MRTASERPWAMDGMALGALNGRPLARQKAGLPRDGILLWEGRATSFRTPRKSLASRMDVKAALSLLLVGTCHRPRLRLLRSRSARELQVRLEPTRMSAPTYNSQAPSAVRV